MSSPVVRLALAVLGGGPHVLTRATELASLVIPPPAPERKVASLADARKRRDEKGEGK